MGGAPEKTVLLSAARHDRACVSSVVAYIRGAHDDQFTTADRAHDLGLTSYQISERGKCDLQVIRAIRDIIVRHDINLIHAHEYRTDLFAYLVRLVLRRRPLALLSTAHGWALLSARGELYRRLDLRLMRRFDHLIAVSHATQKGLVAAGLPASAISILYNGIDTDAWSQRQANEDFRNTLEQGQHFLVVGYIGRITPEKDLHTWLHAAALVKRQSPQARFVVVGDGKDQILLHELQRLAATLRIADQVFFYGYQKNPLPFYAMCDIFMLSSVTEGLSNSILEAMAKGHLFQTDSDPPEALFGEIFAQSDTEAWVDTMLGTDVNLFLHEDLLVKIDRATLAHSLEARPPVLDHVLMEFVVSLPAHLKLMGGQ